MYFFFVFTPGTLQEPVLGEDTNGTFLTALNSSSQKHCHVPPDLLTQERSTLGLCPFAEGLAVKCCPERVLMATAARYILCLLLECKEVRE